MAKRYCGDVTIESYFNVPAGKFRVRVSCPKGYLIEMVQQDGAVGVPETADLVAEKALRQAIDRSGETEGNVNIRSKAQALADAAALGLKNGAYQMRRAKSVPFSDLAATA